MEMGIPRILYSYSVSNGKLVISPQRVLHETPVKENLGKFQLPSTTEPFNSVLYTFFHSLDRKTALVPVSGIAHYLGDSVYRIETLRDEFVNQLENSAIKMYEELGLPSKDMSTGQSLTPSEKIGICKQLCEHYIGQQVAQPVRKAYALFQEITEPEERLKALGCFQGCISTYQVLLDTGSLHPIAKKSVASFIEGLGSLIRDEPVKL